MSNMSKGEFDIKAIELQFTSLLHGLACENYHVQWIISEISSSGPHFDQKQDNIETHSPQYLIPSFSVVVEMIVRWSLSSYLVHCKGHML